MRIAIALTMIIALSACEQTTVPVTAELNAQAVALAAHQNTRLGVEAGTNYIIGETVVSGATISQKLLVRDALANRIRRTSRGELSDFIERDFRDNYCRDPQYRAFIEAGGEIELVFQDQINRFLFAVNIDFC